MCANKTDDFMTPKVSGIVVTYNPERNALAKLLRAIQSQLDHLIVVDNSSSDHLSAWLHSNWNQVEYIPLHDNLGIEKAQNVGISRAQERNSEYVLLLDQDSIPSPNMVSALLKAIETARTAGAKIACAGPRYDDPRQQNPVPFIQIKNFRIQRQRCSTDTPVVNVDYLIASGCLIPLDIIEAVGAMQEELFIDYVDIEWGLRAQQRGFQSLGVCAAFMQHQLGDKPIYFRGRYIPIHSPLRHYYHFRNAVWLYRQSWLRNDWKIVDGFRLLRKFAFYSLMTTPRLEHAKMMSLGVLHGLKGQMGKFHAKRDNRA